MGRHDAGQRSVPDQIEQGRRVIGGIDETQGAG
jgi:hypothetical protein